MSYGTDIIWYTNKQREFSALQESYGMAQNTAERDFLTTTQEKLIQDVKTKLKGNVTISMADKIIDKMIIKKFKYEF